MKFTQFLQPNARQREITIVRGSEIEGRAAALARRGVVFEAEVLLMGDVSLEAMFPKKTDKAGDPLVLAHEIIQNGPEVPLAVDRLVTAAARGIKKLKVKKVRA